MEYRIEFGGEGPQDLTITLRGVGDPDDLAFCNEEVSADPRFRTGLLILVDMSELETWPVTESEVEATADRVQEREWDHPPAAIAYVARGEEVARELMLWRARFGGSRSHREVFASRADAASWLATQR